MTRRSRLATHRRDRILSRRGQMTPSNESSVGSSGKPTSLSSGPTLRTRVVALGKLVEDAALAVEGWRVGIDSVQDAGKKLAETLSEEPPPPYYRRNLW